MLEDGRETTPSLKLLRPARGGFQSVKVPVSREDFFKAAGRLYPHVNLKSMGIRVLSQELFKSGTASETITEELARYSLLWNNFLARWLEDSSPVYVVPAYVGSSDCRDRNVTADSIK